MKYQYCLAQFRIYGSTSLLAFIITYGPFALATNFFNWGIESSRAYYGSTQSAYDAQYFGRSARDCTISHSGACSMKLEVQGNDSGNQSLGADLLSWNPIYKTDFVGSRPIYYRWWMRIMPGFSWGNGTAKVKSSRIAGSTYPRVYTGYIMSYGFLIGECEDVGDILPGGGCILADGSKNSDSNLYIPFDFRKQNDGVWHEYIVKVKPNTLASCTAGVNCDAEFQAWVDGNSVGQYNGFKLHNKTGNPVNECWGGWMVSPYFQLNGTTADGGTIYLDDYSTDDSFNSIAKPKSTISAPKGLKII